MLVHDQGSNFTGAEFKQAGDEWGIVLKGVPTEAHERVGLLERRHTVVRSVYDKLIIDMPDLSPSDRLSYIFRAINDALDSDTGVSATTMVFGVYPKLPGSGSRGSTTEFARIISERTKLAEEMKARTVIRDSMRIEKLVEDYASSRLDELEGLREIGTFEVVTREESKGHRLCSSVFVEKIKQDGTKKSRSVLLHTMTRSTVCSLLHRLCDVHQFVYWFLFVLCIRYRCTLEMPLRNSCSLRLRYADLYAFGLQRSLV